MERSVPVGSGKAAPAFNPFIVTTSLDKTDAQTRKLIRSHVMRGKNKGKSMPRKGKSRGADVNADASLQASHQAALRPHEEEEEDGESGWEHWALTSPRKIAAELSLFRYTQELNHAQKELVFRAFTVVKPATYAVQLFGSDDHASGMFCFNGLSTHPAMVPSLLFTAQAFRDISLGTPLGSLAHTHLAKTLRLLQNSLHDETEATSLSTMVVVSSLATASIILGDLETAAKHLDGLYKIVEVRGGLESLGPLSMITYKALTLDLGLAMGVGTKPRFAQTQSSWSPQIACGPSGRRYSELDVLQPRPDPRLLNIWADLREFSRRANEATEQRKQMEAGLFYHLSTSVLYRLLDLSFEPRSLSETLRLCILAYTKTLLIRVPGLGRKMTFLTRQLEVALRPLPSLGHEGSPFLFWALMISTISIFEGLDEDWVCQGLLDLVADLGLKTWLEAKSVLKGFLWVDMLQDQPAKFIFKTVSATSTTGSRP
ncbi:hypothetical protein B0T16DRAFT_369421 [Cercophora newfieldiana]|uniref:Uncharacterized protein n=1 Tax=Cercophora newfieldiana TaxID=92897 RepID=A0AA40CXC7_9PEZI|nr:hypothetical protein B0T16DRAFT_369421 [Cercophora newfieldiana]